MQPQHLDDARLAEKRRLYCARPMRYHVLDDLVVPGMLERARDALLCDGELKTAYKLYNRQDWTDRDSFEQAPDDSRFIYETIYVRPLAGREMAPSVLQDMQLRSRFRSSQFHAWLQALTGTAVGHTGIINLKRLHREHFLRWHGDGSPGRLLCMILYLHDGWRPEYGGRLLFRHEDGSIEAIDPLFNRAVIFDPTSRAQHAIEQMTESADGWARLNYTVWFNG